MMKALFAALLFLLPLTACADEGVLDVTAPASTQTLIAVPPSIPLDGAAKPEIGTEVAELLRFDLTLTGLFNVASGNLDPTKGIRPGEFDYSLWSASGAKLLLKSGYSVAGDKLTLEFRLYDIPQEKMVTAKRFSGSLRELRRMGHAFSDEVLRALTGEAGPFTGKIAFVSRRTGTKEIYLMDYDGHNVQKLTANGSININPDFFPGGRQIVYTSYKKGNPDLYRRDIFTGSEARISHHRGLNATAAVAASGDRIALTLSKDGNSEIYVISPDGAIISRLTNNGAIDVSPAWSPDGRKIAFVSDRFGKPQVFVMNADGSDIHRITHSGTYNVTPRWSPKGDRIAYCSREGGAFQVHAINPDGSGDVRLTTNGNNEHPRWSPDGRFLLFSSKRGGKEAIYAMRSDGSGQTKLSRDNAEDSHPVWSNRW